MMLVLAIAQLLFSKHGLMTVELTEMAEFR